VEVRAYNFQICYPKGFLSFSSTGLVFPVVRRTFSLTFVVNAPHSCQDYILPLEGSPGTLYGVKGFLFPLVTSELTSQFSPNLRGF
jgi:hypothetical protein